MLISDLHSIKKLLVIFFFITPFITFSQQINLDKKISITVKDKPLDEVLNEISVLGQINFSYSNEQIHRENKITINATDKTIKEILDEIFSDININYIIVENQIILKPLKDKPGKQKDDKEYTINGYIKDINDGETLIGATIYIEGTTIGTITNAYGFYSITLPKGNYKIVYSFIGYENIIIPVELIKNQNISIELEFDNSVLNEVIIIASEQENIIEKNQMSEINITPKTLNNLPGFIGEPDLIKSLQSLPGIKLFGDGSTSFYVRGGNLDQNLILIDEAPIYNPAHLLGFFSVFVPDAIKEIKIYKGDIPANYGGKLSSLIDIKTKDGNLKKFSAYGNYGLITGLLSVEGPIIKDKSSFFISARKSHIRWLIQKASGENSDLYFYDFNFKTNFKINNNNRLFLSCYSGKDYFSVPSGNDDSFGISWGNTAGTLRWNHLFSEKLFSNTTLYLSKYDYFLFTSVKNNDYWNSYIANISLKTDFTYYINLQNTLKFGAKFSGHYFNPGNLYIADTISQYAPFVFNKQANENVLYCSNKQNINGKLSIRYGIRLLTWRNIGPTKVYIFDEKHNLKDTITPAEEEVFNTYFNIEPRLSIKYSVNNTSSFKASYGTTYQHLHLISNLISPFTSLEVWLPSGPNIKPQKAHQFVLGYFKKFPKKNFDFTIESFYKKMFNQIDYKDHAKMLLNPLIEGELRFGKAYSYGIELILNKSIGRLNGWISYTYSRIFKKIDGVNNNNKYPAFYDRPHDLSLSLTYKTLRRWLFSANWVYTTGAAITTPTGFYYYQGRSVPIYTVKNNDRLPDYHRLDLSATIDLNKPQKKFKHSLTFSLYNAYARQNPLSINFNKTINSNNEIKIPANFYTNPYLITSKISLIGIMPAIIYKFKF
ncbi:MAG: TonB-dependent receptor [Bacteroidales bacterium]|nr:TonB-dependent receptor [Bacteroidales bacterium]